MIKLSVLDQSPIRKGGTAVQALQESVELVRLCDRLGYTRYWLSEHHNTRSLAGSAPEVLIARLAPETSRIRLGSGGIMLPNHSTLKVAENFRTLEALFPGRIDLGLGRAPGGDRLTAALLNPNNTFSDQDFLQQLVDLQNFLEDSPEPGSVMEKVKAIPVVQTVPELWLLSSSGASAALAAHFGMGFSFAHFINPEGGQQAVKQYRSRFKPSAQLPKPKASVGIFVLCADTEAKANELRAVMDWQLVHLAQGIRDGIPSYEEVKDHTYSAQEKQLLQYHGQRVVSGAPEQVKIQLTKLAADYGVDEIVAATITHAFEDRRRSYELLAELFGLPHS